MTDLTPTERLYFADPYLCSFKAEVVAQRTSAQGLEVALDRSAFYPEGGGQPGDWGQINGVAVRDTQAENDIVWHLLAAPLIATKVSATIDWERRFDFMQQHHGQHLLSAAFEHLFAAPTVAVHLGAESCTVDIQNTSLTPSQLAAAEDWTNAAIYRNLAINARFVEPAELRTIALRKPPKVTSRIRIVSAGELDHSACGGTHPARTGEVGIVALRCWERRGDTLRIEFLCGGRAVRDYRAKTHLLTTLGSELSVAAADLPAAIQRLRTAEASQRKALIEARAVLASYEADRLLGAAPMIANLAVVAQVLVDQTLDEVRLLAKLITERGGIALLALRSDKAQFVFARPTAQGPDMGALLRIAAAVVGGKGGGKPDAAQGGGPNVSEIEAALAAAVDQLQAS